MTVLGMVFVAPRNDHQLALTPEPQQAHTPCTLLYTSVGKGKILNLVNALSVAQWFWQIKYTHAAFLPQLNKTQLAALIK